MRRIALAGLLGVGLLALAVLPSSALQLTGTPHDLTGKSGYPGNLGECGACHVAHYARELRLWPRDAVNTRGDALVVGNVTGLCLDCHGTGPSSVGWTRNAPFWAHTPFSAYRLSGDTPLPQGAHDLRSSATSLLAQGGAACSVCHRMHLPSGSTRAIEGSVSGKYLANAVFWPRNVTGKLSQLALVRDLSKTAGGNPNYLVGTTLLCYDCHSGTDLETQPFNGILNRTPINVAFSTDKGVVDGAVGYYELPNGAIPSLSGANIAPSLVAVRTKLRSPGGHFLQSPMNMGGVGASVLENFDVRGPEGRLLYRISVGDKLPCDLCHDPHMGMVSSSTDDEVFFRRSIHGGLGTIAKNPHSVFTNPLLASLKTRYGTGNGRLLCFYCHGSSDWDRNINSSNNTRFIRPLVVGNPANNVTLFGIRINTTAGDKPTDGSSWAFPPPRSIAAHAYSSGSVTTPCTECHAHNNIGASCSGCHEYPPTTGAHNQHYAPPPLGPGLNCQACHGPSPGAASWHNQRRGNYNPATDYNYITLMPELTPAQRGAENAYYLTTWSRSGASRLATVTKAPGYNFVCTNAYCHGMLPVKWTWNAMSTANPASSAGYHTCGGCHGMGSDGYNRTVYTSSFRSRAGSLWQATSTAVNYAKPLSGFSRGGHGDVGINTQVPFVESAPNTSLPVACGSCHDGTTSHFPVDPSNPYRMSAAARANPSALPGANATPNELRITNLCTQTNCHPKFPTPTTYGVLDPNISAHRHGSDHYPFSGSTKTYFIQGATKRIILSGNSTNVDPRYNPINLGAGYSPVGIDIDRYVDHWQWWGVPATLADGTDGHPFMPLGDSLGKVSGGNYNNVANSTTLVTCVSCHNPHGTDLFVFGQTPGRSNSFILIPDNKMLRLRYEDNASDELCDACH